MQSLRFCMLVMVIILACAVSSALAQQQPTCALKEAPQLHGFHLGMTIAEVKKSLADSSMFEAKISTVNAVGSRAVNINGSELSPENGEGVENIYLTFVDQRVAHIKVTYNSAKRWDSSQDFFARLSESLGLPKPTGPEAFQGNGENAKYIVECGEFDATLAYAFGVSPNVTVANVVARKMVDKRQEKERTVVREKRLPVLSRPPASPPDTAPPRPNDPRPGQP
ncbi:MAG: hypothetical protein H0X14_01310 [Acidobacteria bacterium]|nr:hypothetical protein [Acidobacteriota bacterium]